MKFILASILSIQLINLNSAQWTPSGYEVITDKPLDQYGALEKCGEGRQAGKFKCVPYHRCVDMVVVSDDKTTITEAQKNGFGIIDIRVGQDDQDHKCNHYLDVCCKLPDGEPPVPSPSPPEPSPTPPKPVQHFCGIRNPNGLDFTAVGTTNEAKYGEFPWMVAVLNKNHKPKDNGALALCGGSLIHPSVVLTGAHCVSNFKAIDVKIRAGEWDTQTTKERLPYQERNVQQIVIHEDFSAQTLFNDFALLVLDGAFDPAEHIGTVCLPNQGETVISNNCIASGWGKDVFGTEGKYQVILKKIELSTIPHGECESALRSTRLGKFFKLDHSFTCAVGEDGKDTCTGDGGSPLVCPDKTNPKRYVQAGIVAWGIGCHAGIPGVYADVSKIRSWVDENMQRLNIDNTPYVV